MLAVDTDLIQPNQPDLTQVQASISAIKQALRNDREFFMQFFMGDELKFAIPEFHIVTFDKMLRSTTNRLALALPRGHNKTTLAKLAVVHYFLHSNYRFIVYVSNTSSIAQEACRDIVGFLESDNFIAVFGHIKKMIWREGEGLYKFELTLDDGSKKICILRALGAGQQVRGINVDKIRPELGIVDDLEDDDNTATKPLILKLKNWVYGPFFKCFNRWMMKIIWLGNMLSEDSLLAYFCSDKAPHWESLRFGCLLANGQPLWPDLWPIDAIIADYKEYEQLGLTARWFAEMMNMPLPGAGGLIQPHEIRYSPYILPGDTKVGFITIDPAISDKNWANDTAIVAHAWIDEHWQIVEFEKSKLDPIGTINIALEMAIKWGFSVVGVEAIAYQAALKFFFRYILVERNMEHMHVVDVPSGARKTEKLAAWCSLIKNGTYTLTEGDVEVTEQLLRYNPQKKANDDDLIDACSQGVKMIDLYLHLIMETFSLSLKHTPAIATSYEVCGV